MKKVNFLVISIFLVCVISASSQNTPITIYQSPVPIRQVAIDLVHNLYLVSETNEIIKLSPKGEVICRYNELRNANISKIYVANPMRIAVYVSSLQLIIYLDINLRERSRASLFDFTSNETEDVGFSRKNELLVFDNESQVLKKINDKGVLLFQSNPLFVSGKKFINPLWIKDTGNDILVVSDSTLLQFDRFGDVQKNEIPLSTKFLNSWGSYLFFQNSLGSLSILDEKKMEWSNSHLFFESSNYCTLDYCIILKGQEIQKVLL